MIVTPLSDKIVVLQVEAEQESAGSIILPDSAHTQPKKGKVISVGEGKLLENGERVALCVKAGDQVLFGSYAGSAVSVDGQELVILTESDILGVEESGLPDTGVDSTQISASNVAPTLTSRFLGGIGSVLEFFPSPERFDDWRIGEDIDVKDWPVAVRRELGDL